MTSLGGWPRATRWASLPMTSHRTTGLSNALLRQYGGIPIAIVMEVQRFTGSSLDWTSSGPGWTGSDTDWTGSGSGCTAAAGLDQQRLG